MRTRAAQIDAIRADQEFWRRLAAEVGPSRYAEPGPMGAWSFGDMAGHLAGWRNRRRSPASAPWPATSPSPMRRGRWTSRTTTASTTGTRDHHADCSPEQLVADYDASYDRLVEVLESLPAEKLSVEVPWIGKPLVEVDFTGHLHDEHVSVVRAWLDGTGS